MYEDYDLGYTHSNEQSYDLDETYDMWAQSYASTSYTSTSYDDTDADDDYARDNDTYEALAYRHYA
jgi:hypothetical protein